MSTNPVVTLSEEMPDNLIEDEELDFDSDSVVDFDYEDEDEDFFVLNNDDEVSADDKASIRKHYYPYFRGGNGTNEDDYC